MEAFKKQLKSAVAALAIVLACSANGEAQVLPRALTTAQPANPSSTTSLTVVTMGLGLAGATITPQVSGTVSFDVQGSMANNTASDGTLGQILYGSGTAPANGTAIGSNLTCTKLAGIVGNAGSASLGIPFAWHCVVPGLTPGVAFWYDVGLESTTGGTSTITNLTVTAKELN